MELAGKVAFVTGGGGGIGGGIAQAFAERGIRLVLADIDLDRARDQAAQCGGEALPLLLDVTSLESWASAREAAHARFGQVDILCNNAGIALPFEPLVETAPEAFDQAMKINVYGVYNGIHIFAADMIARGWGHICNTSSMNGLIAPGMMATYGATKFAVKAMTDALRAELAPAGVGVSAIYPGLTRSFMSTRPRGERAAAMMRSSLNYMEPIWIGRAVISAIEQKTPHIITHPEHKDMVEATFAEVLACFGEPAQPGYSMSN